MVKAVLFDLDGTLVDTSEGVAECVSYAAVNLGYPLLPREELLTFIGPPLTLSFPRHYEMDEATTWEAIRLFREHYNAGAMFKAKPYDGIPELCQALERRGISMAVATNKVEAQAKRLLAHFGLDRWCSPIRGADFAMQVTGDSMSPEYPSGSHIILKRIDPTAFVEWGRVYLLDTDNGPILKIVRRTEAEGVVECVSLNPAYQPFTVPARVIRGWYRVLMCLSLK